MRDTEDNVACIEEFYKELTVEEIQKHIREINSKYTTDVNNDTKLTACDKFEKDPTENE